MAEWITSASVLIAVVTALRCIFKGKISPRLQYALWALVLLRLLVPFSFGSSGLSVQNAVPDDLPEHLTPVGMPDGADTPPDWAAPDAPLQPQDSQERGGAYAGSVSGAAAKAADWGAIMKTAWLAGGAAVILCLLISNLSLYARLRRTREPLDIPGCRLPAYVSELIDTPCLFGLLRPAVYVTPGVSANAAVLRHAIEHETTHYKHGDHIWAALRGVCLALHWYNPLVWLAAALSRRDAELSCDEATIRRIGESERAEYGRTLIGLTCEKRPALLITATTMTGRAAGIRERIALIAKRPKTAAYTLAAVVLIAALAAGCTFTGARDKGEAAFAGRLADIGAEDVSYAQASKGFGLEQISRVLEPEDISALTALLNAIAPEDISLTGVPGEDAYQLFAAVGESGGSEREYLFHVTTDGEIYMTFDKGTAADYGPPNGYWRIESPELAEFIAALAEEKGVGIDPAPSDEWFIDEAWPLALEYAEANGLSVSREDCCVFRYTDGRSADAAFPESGAGRSVQVSFSMGEDGTWAVVPLNALNVIDRGRWETDASELYLGMTADEVTRLLGLPDLTGSGLYFNGYDGVGTFFFNFYDGTPVVWGIRFEDGRVWDIDALVREAVKRDNAQGVQPDELETESHSVVSLDADADGLTVRALSYYGAFLPEGEYGVRAVREAYAPVELTFTRDGNGDYALAAYASGGSPDWAAYVPSAERQLKDSSLQSAMHGLVGAFPYTGRYGMGTTTAGTSVVTDSAGSETGDYDGFLIKYFPGATLMIEPCEEEEISAGKQFGGWEVRYSDRVMDISVGREGLAAIPVTEDMLGVYDVDGACWALRFEKYVKPD